MDETRTLNLYEQLKIACTKPKQYKRLLEVSKGKVALFVLLICMVLTLLGTCLDLVGLGISVGGPKNFLENRISSFQLKDGVLTADENMDFVLAGVHVVMDTSKDKVSEDDYSDQYASEIIFTKSRMVIHNLSSLQSAEIRFANHKSAVVTNHTLVKMLPFFYIILLFSIGISYLAVILRYLIFSGLVAWIVYAGYHLKDTEHKFGKLFQLAIYARVPCELIETVGLVAGISFFNGMLWIAISYFVSYQLVLIGIRKPKETN